MKMIPFGALAAGLAARHPGLTESTVITSLSASAEPGTVGGIEAAAVRGFASPGQLQWVKAKIHFYVAGEPIMEGDYVQVQELDAKLLVNAGRADLATDEEVAKAQTPGKGK